MNLKTRVGALMVSTVDLPRGRGYETAVRNDDGAWRHELTQWSADSAQASARHYELVERLRSDS